MYACCVDVLELFPIELAVEVWVSDQKLADTVMITDIGNVIL
jgi:hypothetical protein